MSNQEVHGIIYSNPPQTTCGLAITEGRKTTTNPFQVTCSQCRQIIDRLGSNRKGAQ